LEEKLNTFSKRIHQRIDNLKFLQKVEKLSKTSTRDGSLEFFWRTASNGIMKEIYFSPLKMTELQKCLVDVLIEFFKGKAITDWTYISLREIENFLRDVNDVPAFLLETVPEELFYSWVGQLIYEVMESTTQWSEKPRIWNDLSQIEKIKETKVVLREIIGFKVELIELLEEGVISINWDGPVSAPIQNSIALFVREVLRKELGNPELEILLET